MVIRLVSHCHALLLQSAATLLVDLHPCIDGRLGGVLAEYAAHLMEHPKDSGSRRCTEKVLLMVNEILRVGVAENSQTAQNQEEYAARYNGFVERYEKAKSRVEELRGTKAAREAQADAIGAFMFEVQELDTLSEFDEKLWLTVIDTVTVHADGRMTFKFQGGTEIDV